MTGYNAGDAQIQKALAAALEDRTPARGWRMTLRVPVAPPECVWDATPGSLATFWETGEGAWAGLGEAAVVTGAGEDRLRALAAGLDRFRAAAWEVDGATASTSPSWFGGAAFAAPGGAAGPWEVFGDARFVLPRWTYHVAGGQAGLTLALPPGTASAAELADELAAILRALTAPPSRAIVEGGVAELREEDEGEWAAGVNAAREAIAAGRLHKVVLVRRTDVRLGSCRPHSALLQRLGAEGKGLFRFGVRIGGAAFVGASPELLVARRGVEVRAEALAASVPRHRDADAAADGALAARLLADGKQRLEHELVVEAVRRALGPVCRELATPATPEVRTLKHLLHLSTPVVGTLASEVGLLELAARLHPTPAVAGEPREQAMEFLAAHERHPRGWFSGPVGRVTADGDGELAVALRSALVSGREAYVYAGAGIVAGSQAQVELAETRAKARTCLAALGVQA